MNLAVLHYHLNRGGVTKVIENHLRSLDAVLPPGETWSVAVFYGGRREGWPDRLADELRAVRLTLHEVPALEYDAVRREGAGFGVQGSDSRSKASEGERLDLGRGENREGPTAHPSSLIPHPSSLLADELAAVLDRLGFTPDKTVLHVHNHALGKNAALAGAVRTLVERGFAMVLQPHDFAEDFRPANFRCLAESPAGRSRRAWSVIPHPSSLISHPSSVHPQPSTLNSQPSWHGWLYPQAPHVHYAVLNGRDRDVLGVAGVDQRRLHLVPNPVPPIADLPPKDKARRRLAKTFGVAAGNRLVLYPVRGIRRKNVGEALLYAALAPPGTVVGLTLPPLNPAEMPVYRRWKELARELRLPACFELGAPGGLTFAENVTAADRILTTSLAEGFGMVFLESWLAGRMLVGRDLPEITADFARVSLRLDALRPRLDVPVDWVGGEAFSQAVTDAYERTLAAYGREQPVDAAAVLSAKAPGGLVDFGDLDEPMQEAVIRTAVAGEANRRRLLDLCPGLNLSFAASAASADDLIAHNAGVIEQHFSVIPSGRRLLRLYEQTAAAPRDQKPQPLARSSRILDAFLDLNRFRLIRS